MAALGLLLLVGVHGTTIISIKYPEKPADVIVEPQPAKRDLSLSYAATNIDSKEGTRVKTITVIKNVGGIPASAAAAAAEEVAALGASAGHNPTKLAIDPKLHKSEEWANAFRDNFESYGALPDVPDIDDLFEFVNRKKPQEGEKKLEASPNRRTRQRRSPPSQRRRLPPGRNQLVSRAMDWQEGGLSRTPARLATSIVTRRWWRRSRAMPSCCPTSSRPTSCASRPPRLAPGYAPKSP